MATAQTSTRIWEEQSKSAAASAHANVTPRPATLPSISTLTGDLPSANTPTSPPYSQTNRTSDQWGSQPQSTRSSALSNVSTGYASTFGYPSSVTSPHRASNTSQLGATSYPSEITSPSSTIASPGFASSQHSSGLPHLNQQYGNQQFADHAQYRGSQHSDHFPSQESRRSSIGSQVNNGFTNLHINGAGSPYANNNNVSQASIAASLQRERGIPPTNGIRTSGTAAIQAPQSMSPLGPNPGESRQAFHARIAPVISSNPMREVYNADKPTAGQPYAFPDPDMSHRSSGSQEANGSTMLSRRNSDHTSITSSIITTDSKMPHGQHRLDDPDPMPGTHHHSLQHKRVSEMSGEGDSPESTTPYSRTPALRASHKLAERKRRTEMKHLFDQLRAQIPASHGNKSSKWEILSKASDHIKNLENSLQNTSQAEMHMQQASNEMDQIRRENEALRAELYHLQELHHQQQRPSTATALHPHPYGGPPTAPPTATIPVTQGSGAPMQIDPSRSLPPLTNGVPPSNSMQGVQYTDEHRR